MEGIFFTPAMAFSMQIHYHELSIYQELDKVKYCTVTVWNIMVQGHQSFVIV